MEVTTTKIVMHHRWGFAYLDHEIGKFYRSLFLLTYGIKLQRPSNSEHITIYNPTDGDRASDIKINKLTFVIKNELELFNEAVVLRCESVELNAIRLAYGLNVIEPELHFCIGYVDSDY